VIGLTLDDFRRIPHVVGVAGGGAKLGAIRGALEGKLIHVLITDNVTVLKLLEEKGPASPARPKRRNR
jgi:DNA-binding transcriptional regulator LsrR (DeoR family)